MRGLPIVVLALFALGGCAEEGKPEINEDFTDLDGFGGKSDAFSYRLKLRGTLADGDSHRGLYTETPRFRGYDFFGNTGDQVDIWVRSSQGDALAWLLDGKFNVIAKSDDADDGTLDSHLQAVLPHSKVAEGRYYIVSRDYYLESHYFTTSLSHNSTGPNADTDTAWQAQAKQTATQMVAAFGSLQPYKVDNATLPAAGQARFAAAIIGQPTAYKIIIDGRICYLVHVIDSTGDISAVDLIDDTGQWFAHGYSAESGAEVVWVLYETDQTICNCTNPINGMAACSWPDGSVVESSVMICD